MTVLEATSLHTGVFVYAVVRAGRSLPADLMGIDGAALGLVHHRDLAAVVSPIAMERPPGRKADLTAYSAVMNRLVPEGAVAPLSFGVVMPDAPSVVDELLAPREDQLGRMLDALEGCVQYNVRASYVEETVLAEIVELDPEIRHLRDRTRNAPQDARMTERVRLGELVARAWEHVARLDADHLLSQVVPITTAHSVRREPGPEAALDAALLVDLRRSQELEDQLETLAEKAHGRLRLTLVGPLAPYDFVGDARWA